MRSYTSYVLVVVSGIISILPGTTQSFSQNTVSPATDWTGNYSFSSPADRNLRLLQADMIEKREKGYYESLGKTTLNQTVNNTTNTTIGQNTNAIGSLNNTTTNIDMNGNNNTIDIDSNSTSTGCQDGSVNIGETGATNGSSGCR